MAQKDIGQCQRDAERFCDSSREKYSGLVVLVVVGEWSGFYVGRR
jgi:hypothetical protein